MAERVMAKANPAMLRWARETRGYTLEQAAESLKIDPGLLAQAERGDAKLSFAKLRQAGERYKRPLAVFFLPKPPEAQPGVADFRRLPEAQGHPYSPNLLFQLRRLAHKRSVAIRLAEFAPLRNWDFVGSVAMGSDPEAIGALIRQRFNLPMAVTSRWRDQYAQLNGWRTAVEATGALVFAVQRVSVSEMRGMSIAEVPFPVIALNRADAPSARLFSLLHEFTHLLIGRSGLCDDYEAGDYLNNEEARRVEVFCNAVAASALIPMDAVRSLVQRRRDGGWEEGELRALADRPGLSAEAFLRRLVVMGMASAQEYEAMRREWQARSAPALNVDAQEDAEEGQSFGEKGYEVVLRTQGENYVRMIIDAMHSEAITAADASDFLDMKLKHLAGLEGTLVGG